jgi:hypothetical protein
MKDAESTLLKGDHTRAISQPTPSNSAGGIMRFAKVEPCKLTPIHWGGYLFKGGIRV